MAPKQKALDSAWRMSPKQALFVAEYLKDLNATQAALRAGYAKSTAEAQASRLLGVVGIREAVEAGRAKQLEAAGLSAERNLRELAAIAYSDTRTFFDEQGNVKPISEWSPEMGAAVAGFEVVLKNAAAGDGIIDRVLKIKRESKVKALEMAMKHFGQLEDRVHVSGELETVSARLIAARKRLAAKGAK